AFLLTATVAGTASVAAQEVNEIPVNAILCADEDCTEFGDAVPNFTIIALDDTSGEELDRCVTDGAGAACTLVVPADVDLSIDWIPEEVPAGYLFRAITGEDLV